MPKIKLLDEATINKIAAGEVIDRPASIIKELIDNCIDAQASLIRIELENGGITSLRITDNGQGISKEDLPLAPLRHATSKINSLEDIYNGTTMGFRGEALASICHVAKLKITSKTKNDPAYEITADPKISTPKLTNHQTGTTILVQDLFAKIPVRRRYLKSPATEFAYIYETVQRFALLFPAIDFVLIHNQKEVLNTTGVHQLKDLLLLFWGKNLLPHLIEINTTYANVTITGFISSPQLTFSNRNYQVLAINQRLVKNALLQKVINNLFTDLIPARRFPLVVLNITLNPQLIDVNIHPQKNDVKFLNSGMMFECTRKILTSNLQNKEVIQAQNPMPFEPIFKTQPQTLPFNTATFTSAPTITSSQNQLPATNLSEGNYFQIFNTYLIINAGDAVWLVDQHAAHERILYERLKAKTAQSQQNKQLLLVPEIIELPPPDYALLLAHQDQLTQLAFELDDFGNNQIILRAIPIDFVGMDITEFLVNFLGELKELEQVKTESHLSMQERNLESIACKAAIKAGKKLSSAEIQHLINDLLATPGNYTCPHGRPLFIKLTKEELEKLFLRR